MNVQDFLASYVTIIISVDALLDSISGGKLGDY